MFFEDTCLGAPARILAFRKRELYAAGIDFRLLFAYDVLMRRKRNSPPIVIPPYHCPLCGYDMDVSEMLRKDFEQVICAKCGKAFSG